MTIFSSVHSQACHFIFIYSDLILGASCISRNLNIISVYNCQVTMLSYLKPINIIYQLYLNKKICQKII